MDGVSDIVIFLGRFHPLFVHFPIGFLTLALLLEVRARRAGAEKYDTVLTLVWLLSGLSAVVAVVLGYLLSFGGGYDEDTLALHQWFGISLAALCFVCYFLRKEKLSGNAYVGRWYFTLLILIFVSLVIAGHLGASLTHGSEYLVEYAPKPIQRLLGVSTAEIEERPKVTSLDSADIFKDAIAPIFNSKCISCHNSKKKKGELILTSFGEMMKGGEDGPIIKPGSLASSEIYRRITLPHDHDEFMPSEGKRPLTDEQLAIIEWWIVKNAPDSGAITSLHPDEGMVELFEQYFGLGKNGYEEIQVPPPDTAAIRILIRNGFTIRRLAATSNLLEARFSGGVSDTSKLILLLAVKEQLVWLQLSNTGVSDDALKIVGRLSNLRKLNLSKNNIYDLGVKQLLNLTKLEYLNLYETKVTDSVLVSLVTLPQLKELFLWQTRVTREYVEKFETGKPDLQIIYKAP